MILNISVLVFLIFMFNLVVRCFFLALFFVCCIQLLLLFVLTHLIFFSFVLLLFPRDPLVGPVSLAFGESSK